MTAVGAIDDPMRSLLATLHQGVAGLVDVERIERTMRSFAREAARRLRGHTPAQRKRQRDRCLAALRPLLEPGSVLEAVRKRGEAGTRSYEALCRALGNDPAGDNPAAAGFDRFLMKTNALSALRARRTFFQRELRYRYARAAPARPFRVLAFGAGPRSVLLTFLRSLGPAAERVQATLMDGDAGCLAAARVEAERGGFGARLTTLDVDPVRASLLGKGQDLGQQDFLFSPGLLDFLPDEVAGKVLGFAFGLLGRGGAMVMAHYHRDLTAVDRLVMEWWLEWFPYFRTPRHIGTLLASTAVREEGVAAGLLRGPNVYLVVERIARG